MAAGQLEYLRLEENKKTELRIANELVGNYECHRYDADDKTDWHCVEVTSNGDGVLKWTNRAGRSWTLTMRGVDYPYRVKPTLMTDKDCPHFESIKFVEIRRHWWWKKNVTALVFGGDSVSQSSLLGDCARVFMNGGYFYYFSIYIVLHLCVPPSEDS